jgi:zinc transporter, ZIP family
MGLWIALFWGAFTSAALYLGQLLAGPIGSRNRVLGLVMGFGGGTMVSAVAYELIPETSFKAPGSEHGWKIGLGVLLGALVYLAGDTLIDRRGGQDRHRITGGENGSGLAMFLGALLDGIPEAFILGAGLGMGSTVSVAFVIAVFVSNVPQGIAGTTSMRTAGYTSRHVFWMWTGLTAAAAAAAGAGYLLADPGSNTTLYAQAFAGGAVLMMLTDSMFPDALKFGGRAVGLLTVLGYLVAAAFSVS